MKPQGYSYRSSLKSGISDELINTYVIRPLAGVVVRMLYRSSITPNQVTIASLLVGAIAAFSYVSGSALGNLRAGLLVTLKDVLDSADGQLARAKGQFSRAGRFLDSIGDLIVNLLLFSAIGIAQFHRSHSAEHLVLASIAFLGTTLRVSYHVFYQTSFLHLEKQYEGNRTTEDLQPEDFLQDRVTLTLQRLFQVLYGWQDRMMVRLDNWARRGVGWEHEAYRWWYSDRVALRLSGLIGLGTELFIVTIFSLADELEAYLLFNVTMMNAIWLACVLYRRLSLASRITRHFPAARSGDSPQY